MHRVFDLKVLLRDNEANLTKAVVKNLPKDASVTVLVCRVRLDAIVNLFEVIVSQRWESVLRKQELHDMLFENHRGRSRYHLS